MIACSIAAHVRADIALPFAQIEDRIADELAGTVIGHVAAAVRGIECDARALQDFVAREQVFHVAVAAERDDVRMLEEQQLIGDAAPLALRDEPLLQFAAPRRNRSGRVGAAQQLRIDG